MFTSEKELRSKKPTASSAARSTTARSTGVIMTPTPVSGTAATALNAADVAKQAREERSRQREHSAVCVRIQTWWRAVHTRRAWRTSLTTELDKKLKDVRNVNALLKIVICPDSKVSIQLARLLIFSRPTGESMREATYSLCVLILGPSLSNMDTSKNMASHLSPYLAYSLMDFIFQSLLLPPKKHISGTDTTTGIEQALSCLSLLIGSGESYRMKFSAELETSFRRIRLYLDSQRILEKIGHILFRKLDRWMLNTSDDETQPHAALSSKTVTLDGLVDFCLAFAGSDIEAGVTQRRLISFVQRILTVPMLTLLLSPHALDSIVTSSLFKGVLAYCEALFPVLELPPSAILAFDSEIWLLGNLTSLGPALLRLSPALLTAFLKVCCQTTLKFHIPRVLQGKRGVVWTKRGAESVAAGVPNGLYVQMGKAFEPGFLAELVMRLVDDTYLEGAGFVGNAKDVEDITESLKSNAVNLTSAAVEDEQQGRSWMSGKWAIKMLKSVSGSIGLSHKGARTATTTASASGSAATKVTPLDHNSVSAISAYLAVILTPAALSSYDSDNWKGLSSLAFSKIASTVHRLWTLLLSMNIQDYAAGSSSGKQPGFSASKDMHPSGTFGAVAAFVSVLRVSLLVCDDRELYEGGKPLPLHQIYIVVRCLKQLLFKILQYDHTLLRDPAPGEPRSDLWFANSTARVISLVLKELHTRWARRPFSTPALFEVDETNTRSMRAELREQTPFAVALLDNMPWCIQFYERMSLFREMVAADRARVQGPDLMHRNDDVLHIRVRRRAIVEDGMRAVEKQGSTIRKRLLIKYVNDFNEEEIGIDSGGLFKDFWTELSSQVFNASYGLFASTSTRHLYPSSTSLTLYNEREVESLFHFLGLVLGKALYENMTVQPLFAHFFLSFFTKYDFTGLINDLVTLDQELYKNLMFLKNYEGDIGDLSLTFTVTDTSVGTNKEIELIAGGSSVNVDSLNRHRYISAVAKYYLHDRIKVQARAFFNGLYKVIDPVMFAMFCAPELQFLISGGSVAINLEDWKRNTAYAGGYSSLDSNIVRFWSVAQEMSQDDQTLLLRFVTSCDRPPSLGFSDLHPAFTIQRADGENDSRLPTASTCFNVLKLPSYTSKAVLKDKLLFAIRSRSGFDLS